MEVDSDDDDDMGSDGENRSLYDIHEDDSSMSDSDADLHYGNDIPQAVMPLRRRRRNRPNQNDLAYDFLLALRQHHMPGSGNNNNNNEQQFVGEQVPYQRYGHTVVAYGGKAYLWGGRNDEFGSSQLLHEYNPGGILLFENSGF